MSVGADWIVDQLHQLLPADRLQADPCALAAFQSDGLTAFAVRPKAVVVPRSIDEVVRVVRWCYQQRIPLVARGSGTSLSGGSLPHAEGIVIALNRLNRILEIDLANRWAVVEPGVINSQLTAAVEQALVLCTRSQQPAGLYHWRQRGLQFRWGSLSEIRHDQQPHPGPEDGSGRWRGGRGRAAGEVIGPDMVGLMVGGEGLLGIAVEITVRLLPSQKVFIPCWRVMQRWSRRATRWRGSSAAACCPPPSRSWIG